MKKILFYTDTPLIGGAEHHMRTLAKFLPKEEFEITLACSGFQSLNAWCQQFMEMKISVIRFPVLHKHDPRHFAYLRKIVSQFDLLHMHVWNPASGRYGYLAAGRTPLVVTEHDPFALGGARGWIKNVLARKTARIIVASQEARNLVMAQNPGSAALAEKIRCVPNAIDAEQFLSSIKHDFNRSEFRRENFHIENDEPVILCVAELHERKGQDVLCRAMQDVTKTNPKARLVLVGEGGMQKSYERLAKNLGIEVRFLGKRKDVAALMKASDLFVLPSRREAFGLVILEAGTVGVPVIASDVGGIPEIIEHGVSGILVPPENPIVLGTAISELLEDASKRLSLAKNLMERVATKFRAEVMAEQTAAVYDEVLSRNL